MPSTDLCEAVIAELVATPSVVSAFGDTWDAAADEGTSKFFYDYSNQATEPYLVCMEIGETYDYMTKTPLVNYVATGQLLIEIHQADRKAARQLGVLVDSVLSDAALTWLGCVLMEFRIKQASFVPVTVSGPITPYTFNRVLVYDYVYSGVL